MQGKRITVTQKGRTAIELIRHAGVDLLTSPEMTGQWERRLNQISKGEASNDRFMENVKKFTMFIIDKVRTQRPAAKEAFGDTEDSNAKGKGNAKSRAKKPTSSTSASPSASPSGSTRSSSAPLTLEPIGPCPRQGCGGSIIMGRKGYGCNHFKEGCKFVIWKTSLGKTLTDAMIKSLIEKGSTQVLSFKQEDGTTQKARIVLSNPETGELQIEQT
jgi:DNA topoisomerase-3